MGLSSELRTRLEEQADIIVKLQMISDYDGSLQARKDYPLGFNFINHRLFEWGILKTCILFDEDSYSGFQKTINTLSKGAKTSLHNKYTELKVTFDTLNLKDIRDEHIAHLDSSRIGREFDHSEFHQLLEKIKSLHNQIRKAYTKQFHLNTEHFVFSGNSKYLIELLPNNQSE